MGIVTGCLSFGRRPGGEWANTLHWKNRLAFYSLLFRLQVVAAQLLPHSLPYRIYEKYNNYTIR